MAETKRSGALLWAGVTLLAAFAGLVVYQKVAVGRMRFVGSDRLLKELAAVEFRDEPAVPGWPQWRGPRRDGVTSMPDLLRTWEADPPRKWRNKPGGDGYSSFAIADGRLCTMLPADDKEAVVCWDLATGKELWRHDYEPGATFDYGGPRATPTRHGLSHGASLRRCSRALARGRTSRPGRAGPMGRTARSA